MRVDAVHRLSLIHISKHHRNQPLLLIDNRQAVELMFPNDIIRNLEGSREGEIRKNIINADLECTLWVITNLALPESILPSAPCHQGREGVLFQSVSFEPPVEAALPHLSLIHI